MNAWVMAAVLCGAVSIPVDEQKLGEGVTLKEATPIARLTEQPKAFVGKTIRVDGVATAVCEMMGCWMAIAPENDATGQTVRLKVEDGVIVFPVSAKGKKVSAQGVFEVVGADKESQEAAGEHASRDPKASAAYQIKATGAVIK